MDLLQIRLIQRAGAGVNIQQKEIRLAQISLGIVAGKIKLNKQSRLKTIFVLSVYWLPCHVVRQQTDISQKE